MKKITVAAALAFALAPFAGGTARADAPKAASAPAAAPAAAPAPAAPAAPEAKTAAAPAPAEKKAKAAGEKTIEGELVDLACYLDHGAKGEKHKACATTCAQNGLPIGLLDKHNHLTLVIGDHKPMNSELAPKMGDTVKLTGKISSRNGMKLIEVSTVE